MNRIICASIIATALSLYATAEELTCTVRCISVGNGSAERTFIKGIDGLEREVKILSPDEYDLLTNRLEIAWAFMHATHENRVKVHGSSVRSYIDENNAEKITEYKDGYRFVEKMVVKTRMVRDQFAVTTKRTPPIPRKPRGISARQWKARQDREAAEKAAPREVNVIYNANNGTTKEIK